MKQINVIKRVVTIIIILSLLVSGLNINKITIYADETKEKLKVENQAVALSENDVPDVMEYDTALKNKHIKREREKETGLNELIFENQDGTNTLYVYDKNIKYIDENGVTKDIDTGIERSNKKGYSYTNGENIVNVDFPDYIKDGLIVEYEQNEIKMHPVNYVGGKLSVLDGKVIYDNIYGSGTQLIYTPTLNGVKEEIVLEKYNKRDKYSFNVTVAAKEWINNSTKRSCGLLFKAANISTVQSKTFASYQRGSYQPTFTMVYVNNTKAYDWVTLNNLRGAEYGGQLYEPNCFGYVLGLDYSIESAEGFSPNTSSVSTFVNDVKNYINNRVVGKSVVYTIYGEWRTYALKENQYLIAMRIGAQNNYHFKVQIDDGRWTEKNQFAPATTPTYYNPTNSTNWNSAYGSSTVYMVIQVD